MPDALVFVTPALAKTQVAAPMARLADLAKRKGDDDTSMGQICANAKIPTKNQKCLAYQIDYEGGPVIPSFNVLKEPFGDTVIFIIRHTPPTDPDKSDVAQVYVTGVDGTLRQALSGKRGDERNWDWRSLSISDAEVRSGFAKEVSFWLDHIKDVRKWPDAKR